MTFENLQKILTLKLTKGIGNKRGKEIIDKNQWDKVDFNNPLTKQKVEKEIEKIQKKKVSVVTLLDSNYPPLLKEIYDPPLILYYFGNIDAHLPVAVVGTRNHTRYGAKACSVFSQELTHGGATVVSGFAPGIDTIAHKTAVESKKPTIAVLGCGVDFNYPPENLKLKREVVQNGGAIVSEFALGTEPAAYHFPMRNRIISGLSLALLMIEGKISSGALITAKLAAEQGRSVYVLPGSVFEESFLGNHTLLREGGILARSGSDILADLGHTTLIKEKDSKQKEAFLTKKRDFILTEEEKLVFELLETHTPLEFLISQTGMAPAKLLSLLTQLALKGAVEEKGGFYFKA